MDTFTNNHLPRERQENSSITGSSSNNRSGSKFLHKLVFQLDQCVDPTYCSFRVQFHPENSSSYGKRVVNSICTHRLDAYGDTQEKMEDIDDNEEVAPDEAPCLGMW